MDKKICCFCGHRDCDSSIREQIKETITDLIENQGITTFYSGGMGNFDKRCEGVARELKQKYKDSDIENFTNFEKDGTQINMYGATEYKNLYDALEKLKAEANDDENKEILNAQDGINEKDDNKVITALKKLTPFIEKVSSSVISTAITAYMKAHGLIP